VAKGAFEGRLWSFVFEMDIPSGEILCPSSVIVLVDAESGNAHYFPSL
jgi:hypothetical protein